MEHRDDIGAKLGMWVFIFTEILLFGGLFLVYAIMRLSYSNEFHQAAHHLNAFIGTINTIVLLVSSATVAMSITAVQKGNNKLAVLLLFITLICAAVFMVNKYFEWGHKIHIGLYPGSDLMVSLSHGQVMFFSLYYFMTGLHMFHLVVGGIILTIVMIKVQTGTINASRYVLLENGGLYWHLVDLIWIFLFPLLYLIT
ncbi:MAG: cytochrome c oxidase subunit 3 family protein [Bacteroidetes bacterium]|nr:cytochrome c oxidase subunit 3 family protein [Bacteroidota bacterium]